MRFAGFVLELFSAGSDVDGDWISTSGSTRDLRLVAEAVICFETFSFCVSAPPWPRPGRVKERVSVGEGGTSGMGASGVVGV